MDRSVVRATEALRLTSPSRGPVVRACRVVLLSFALSAVLGCGTDTPTDSGRTEPPQREPINWYALAVDTDDRGVATDWSLRTGALGLEPIELHGHIEDPPVRTRLGVMPFIAGATAANVILVVPHRTGTSVQRIDYLGEVTRTVELSTWVDAAALAYESGRLFVALLDAEGRDDGIAEIREGGVLRITRGNPERAVVAPNGDPSGWHRRITASPDGRTIFETWCRLGNCSLRLIDSGEGRSVPGLDDAQVSFIYGASSDRLFFDDNCERPCPIGTYSVAQGTTHGIGTISDRAMLIPLSRPTMIVWDEASGVEGRDYEINLTDIVSQGDRQLYVSSGEGRMLVPDSTQGYVAHPPIVLIAGRRGFFTPGLSNVFRILDPGSGWTVERTVPLRPAGSSGS